MGDKWVMTVECCICHRFIKTVKVDKDPKGMISHGICPICLPDYHARMMAEVEEYLKREVNNV